MSEAEILAVEVIGGTGILERVILSGSLQQAQEWARMEVARRRTGYIYNAGTLIRGGLN